MFGLCWGKGRHTTDQGGRRKCLVSVGGKVDTHVIKVATPLSWSLCYGGSGIHTSDQGGDVTAVATHC